MTEGILFMLGGVVVLMGVKDIEEKQFEDYNDVFADIVNVLLFDGKELIKPEELENSKDKSRFKATDGTIKEQERDVSKWWRKNKIRLAFLGVENQTKPDPKICLRLYGYDGAVYKSEYYENVQYPVITIVLYFNYKRHWKGPKRLLQGMQVPNELKPYVNDYKMNLFEVAWLTDKQVEMFKSDFKIVADYFVQMRKNNDYIPSPEAIKHVDAILKLMTALTGDSRFEDEVDQIFKKEGRVVTMCEWLDKVEKRGEKIGRFKLIIQMVNDNIARKRLTQKLACEDLNREYLAAKRFMKKYEVLADK